VGRQKGNRHRLGGETILRQRVFHFRRAWPEDSARLPSLNVPQAFRALPTQQRSAETLGQGPQTERLSRDDAIVLLVAAGPGKVKLIRQVIELGLCNALITDDTTANALV
jgi:hypothetical protein